ncbi:MAG: type I-C CRISPR-associated protein Cas8c/Csd1 [Acidobacteriia bacterium]|nr:type I-C CRISPR-associated protein Cas8c/Csd1 [Terriglobia bacterium]
MIAELLDLADRLQIPTPRPFELMRVHYFIDLSEEGEILSITPACGNTKDRSGELELGKLMECPAYFSLKIKNGTENEIQAAAGGGVSVAEAGHGDTREIFCTEITTPKGKPPKVTMIQPPPVGQVAMPESDDDTSSDLDREDSSNQEEGVDSGVQAGKNQYYRHDGWMKRLNSFIVAYPKAEGSRAIKGFIAAKNRLTDPLVLAHFSLPDPAQAEMNASTAEEKKKARDAAAKECNALLKQIAGSRFTLRINGQVLLKNREFKEWWASSYAEERSRVLKVLPVGTDGFNFRFDEGSTRLTPVFPHIPSVPGGGMYCPLASFDKAATRSFGLEKYTLPMSLTTTERTAAALKWLLQDKRSNCTLGKKLVAIFWAVPPSKDAKPCSHDLVAMLTEPDALQVLDFFQNIHGQSAATFDAAHFYCAILSSPKSRITVRSWHTETLGRVTEWAKRYFEAVSLPDVFQPEQRKTSPLGDLTDSIVPPKNKSGPTPGTYASLLRTALFGTSLPHSFLESALMRQCLELAKGCADKKGRSEFESRLRARTALIKLFFHTNKRLTMDEHTHQTQDHPAYLCGRVLAVMDKIHNAAHGKSTASSPAGRYYGSASNTPALVFPRLCKLARIHLDKIGGGLAYKLEHGVPKDRAETPLGVDFDGLAALIAKFDANQCWPRTLSLEEQGRFAIGFYYERCRKWPRFRKGENPRGDELATDDTQNTDELTNKA